VDKTRKPIRALVIDDVQEITINYVRMLEMPGVKPQLVLRVRD
jgi:hypothetical protein